jgi:PAS domain S-box-containing protein
MRLLLPWHTVATSSVRSAVGRGTSVTPDGQPPDAADGRSVAVEKNDMRRPSFFLVRLLSTAVVVVAPLLAVTGYTLYSNLQRAKAEAYDDVRDRAAAGARVVEEALDNSERLLRFVASHEEVRSLTPERCTQFMRGLEAMESVQGLVAIVDINGQLTCASSPVPPGYANVEADSKWFDEARAANGFVLTSPFVSRMNDRPVMLVTYPIRNGPGPVTAIAAVSIDLVKLETEMRGDWAQKRGVIALVSKDDRLIVRGPGTRENLGKPASAAVVSLRGAEAKGVVVAKGTDNIERVYTAVGVSRYGLRVATSLPAEEVLAAPYAEIRRGALTAAVALVLAAIFGWLGLRSLSGPLKSLGATAKGHAQGRSELRADEGLPGEFGNLAVEMNAMLDARKDSQAEAERAQRREGRLARFYECLLLTNQAIARINDPIELYQRVCAVCVDTGQASLSWVGEIRGDQLVPVAWGGSAAEYTRGINISVTGLPGGRGLGGPAILAGETAVANDYMNDPRTLLLRENASKFGIRSLCFTPLSCGGRVVATLSLYSNESNFFDEDLVRLIKDLARDVSSALDAFRRAAEHARTLEELKLSEASLAGIVESSLDAIVTIDARGVIRLWNGAAEHMFGATALEAVGSSSFQFIPAGLDADHASRLERFTAEASSAPVSKQRRPVNLTRKDGTLFPAHVSVARIHVAGEPLLVATLRDATTEREAEQARDSAARAQASNSAKSDFMSRMSHELRTPLNVVLGFSQLLQEAAKKRLDEREKKQLDLIFLAGAQLRALVDDVLDFSVIESGHLHLSLQEFELTELLDGVIRMSEASARATSVLLETTYSSLRPLDLRTDPVRLRQVMLNLISNAVKYNRPGGSVVVSVEGKHGLVGIEVADTGLGMSDEQVASLFQPFNRLGRERSEIVGTGIGMVLVRQLVELMGGTLSVESEVDRGTVVRVELPRPRIAEPLLDVDSSKLPLTPVGSPDGGEDEPEGVILYIEDNPVNVLLVQEMLREWSKVRVVVAEDGEAGIAMAMELRPDIVLLDMQLPDMTGLDVLSAFNAMRAMPVLRVVGLSASAMDDEVAAATAAGVIDYWKKPVDVAAFRKGVRRLLRGVVLA